MPVLKDGATVVATGSTIVRAGDLWVVDAGSIDDAGRGLRVATERTDLSPPEFLLRFTPQERVAIRASQDPILVDWLLILNDPRLTRVDLTLPATRGGLDYLVALKLLKADRVDAILTPAED